MTHHISGALLLVIAASCCTFAQDKGDIVYQTGGPVAVAGRVFGKASVPVVGAPYTATITNESVQTLADGNRIVQTSTGSTARDSQGRTRQDTVLPQIGNLSAADAPHLVFIHDPVAQTSYSLNLTDKTAHKMAPPPALLAGSAGVGGAAVTVRAGDGNGAPLPPPDDMAFALAGPGPGAFFEKRMIAKEGGQVSVEDLGSQTMEGILVKGTRTTHTIPAGQIGNEAPITIVSEVWTSPELQTVVYSKRSDPRIGEQTFRLTNIVRAEPNSSLFTVPADFRIVDDPAPIVYRTKQ